MSHLYIPPCLHLDFVNNSGTIRNGFFQKTAIKPLVTAITRSTRPPIKPSFEKENAIYWRTEPRSSGMSVRFVSGVRTTTGCGVNGGAA